MLIIIDSTTKQVINNMGPHPMYPDGNIPDLLIAENEQAVRILDGSELAQKILAAEPHSYTLAFDEEGNCVDAIVTKTIAEWQAENPTIPEPTMEDYLVELDFRLCMIELGLN
jgi:hypothetical protein